MKKRLTVIVALVLALFLCSCQGVYTRPAVEGEQDTSYAVLSNGGSVVQYGNYVYFINGYRDYTDDASASNNELGKVEKGGIYRAELINGSKGLGKTKKEYTFYNQRQEIYIFDPSASATGQGEEISYLEFKSTPEIVVDEYEVDENGEFVLDENDEQIPFRWHTEHRVNVEQIVAKTVGTSSYKDGGIFIYDGYIFYASPNNHKNNEGIVQVNKTDFFRTTIDGSRTEKIYTTKEDSNEQGKNAYAFYKYDSNYYLVAQDGTNLISVKMDSKINDPVLLAENVTSALLPVKDIYYNFTENGVTYKTDENDVESFIYYTRAATEDDGVKSGAYLEMMRPDGSMNYSICSDPSSIKLLNTDNGLLFYELTNKYSARAVTYTNLHSLLAEKNEQYASAYPNRRNVNETILFNTSPYSTVKCINPNPQNIGEVYILAFGESSIRLVGDNNGFFVRDIFAESADFVRVEENRLYFINNGGLKYVDWFNGGEVTTVIQSASGAPTFMFDMITGYAVYFDTVTGFNGTYTKFQPLSDLSKNPIFIGHIIEDDKIE